MGSFSNLVSVWGAYSGVTAVCTYGSGYVDLWGYGTEKSYVVHFVLHNPPALLMTRFDPENQKYKFGLKLF